MFAGLDIHVPWYKPLLPAGLAIHMEDAVKQALEVAYMAGLKDGILYTAIACFLLYFLFLKKD